MNSSSSSFFSSADIAAPVVQEVARVAETQWQALADGQQIGRGDSSRRPDGRIFLSIDAWHRTVFDRLAGAMVADLTPPLHTVVDADDVDLRAAWARAGFSVGRREWEYQVPTDPRLTGLDAAPLPPGVTIVPAGHAEEGPLRALDRLVRDEVEATVGWRTMPAEVLPLPAGTTVVDPSRYAVASLDGRYVGLIRVAPIPRRPRIGLIAVRADQQRQGIGRALLAHALGVLRRSGTDTAWAEVHEANAAALALVEGAGARRVGSNLELVLG